MKKLLFSFAALLIFFCLTEIFLGYVLWTQHAGPSSTVVYTIKKTYDRLAPSSNAKTIRVSYAPRSMYVADRYLGYASRPGTYTVELEDEANGRSHTFTTTINEHGNRITSHAPERFAGKKEIWVFGDSYAYGWGNNNETSFPFFLQQFFPNFHVVNYADNGYGNIHAYLQLKREFETKKTPPEVIVIVYADYFNVRNVASPGRLREYRHNDFSATTDPATFLHPRAAVKNEKLVLDYVPLFREFTQEPDAHDPPLSVQYEVTKKLLSEIHDLGKRNNANMILAFLRGSDSDEAVTHAQRIGYLLCDLRPSDRRKEWDDFAPFDLHPGPLTQNHYAIKLHKTITEITKTAGAVQAEHR